MPCLETMLKQKESSWRRYRRERLELELDGASDENLRDLTKKWIQDSFYLFLTKTFNFNPAPISGFALETISTAFESLTQGEYPVLMLSMPPRSGKTTLGRLLLAWSLGKDPNTNHIITSCSQKSSELLRKQVKQTLESPQFRSYFSDHPDPIGQVLPACVGSSVSGFAYGGLNKNPGIWLIDDAQYGIGLNDLEEFDPESLTYNKEWLDQVRITRGIQNKAIVVLGTRRGKNDIFDYFLSELGEFDPDKNPNGVVHINLSAFVESEDEAKEDILGRRPGERLFTDLRFSSSDPRNSLGKEKFSWFYKGCAPPPNNSGLKTFHGDLVLDKVVVSIDPSSQEAGNTGICIAGVTRSRDKMFVLDCFEGPMTTELLEKYVYLATIAYGAQQILVVKSSTLSGPLVHYLSSRGFAVSGAKGPSSSQETCWQSLKDSESVRVSERLLPTFSSEEIEGKLLAILVAHKNLLPETI